MSKLSFYEQAGIVIPGAILVFGLVFLTPELKDFLAKDGITVGGLGVYLIVSYAAGHLIAAVGNVVEWLAWLVSGGRPSTWLTKEKPKIISAAQVQQLSANVTARLGLPDPKLPGLSKGEWEPIWWQLYTDVLNCSPGRVEIHNGNYGLNRGLAAAFALLGLLLTIDGKLCPRGIALFVVALVFLLRMRRFGIHFVREICNQFMLLPPTPGEKLQSKK
jgi:hypothetical protein